MKSIAELVDLAETELQIATDHREGQSGNSEGKRETARYHVARAQVYATLAAALNGGGR